MKRSKKVTGFIVFLAVLLAATVLSAQTTAQKKLCDFAIDRMYLTKDCRVAVVVKNLGPGLVPDGVWTVHTPKSAGVYLYRNGTGWGGAAIWKFDPAKNLKTPGAVVTYVSNLQVTGTQGIKAVVDLWKVVPEANEGNNSLELKLTCESQPDQPNKPDCSYTEQKDQNGQVQYLLTGKDCQSIIDSAGKAYSHGDCEGACHCTYSDNCKCQICRGCCTEILKKISR